MDSNNRVEMYKYVNQLLLVGAEHIIFSFFKQDELGIN